MAHATIPGEPTSVAPRPARPGARHLLRSAFAAYVGLHLACLAVLWTGTSAFAVLFALGLYLVRMFGITGGYHRYFSHRAYRLSRPWQLALALLGNLAAQRGPLWWAAHHRHHHRFADRPEDRHSPRQLGFFWSHVGWIWLPENRRTNPELVRDLLRFPELAWLDRHHLVAPAILAATTFGLGALLARLAPGLGTSGPQLLVWGFCISTVALYHATYSINSIAHRFGTRRYETPDDSRNNGWLALLTLGEGWHNNHHRYPGSGRQGFFWWEYDPTWTALRVLSLVGIVRELRGAPASALRPGAAAP